MEVGKRKINFKLFNLNLIVLTTLLLFFLSLFKGFLGFLSFSSFFMIGLSVFLIYFLLVRRIRSPVLGIFVFIFIFVNCALCYLSIIFVRDAVLMGYRFTDLTLPVIVFFFAPLVE